MLKNANGQPEVNFPAWLRNSAGYKMQKGIANGLQSIQPGLNSLPAKRRNSAEAQSLMWAGRQPVFGGPNYKQPPPPTPTPAPAPQRYTTNYQTPYGTMSTSSSRPNTNPYVVPPAPQQRPTARVAPTSGTALQMSKLQPPSPLQMSKLQPPSPLQMAKLQPTTFSKYPSI